MTLDYSAEVRIGSRILGPDAPTLVIAEIGNNHDGSIKQAEAMVRAASECGADAVKFQTHIAEAEMLPSTPTPPHFDEPRYSFTQRMELDLDAQLHLKALAEECGMLFLSSPFSVAAVELLERVEVPAYKVASGEVTNPPLLEAVAATGRPVLISSGMSGLEDLEAALEVLRGGGCPVVLMQCTSTYPCPPEKVHLRAMVAMRERFKCPVGLSDHTDDIYTSIAAVALGAVCVEKHFTLSRRLYGPDHHASLEPDALRRLVDGVRQVEAALGSPEKERQAEHDAVRATFEKSIVTAVPVPAGATLERAMVTTKRPGTGIPAARISSVIGRRAVRALESNVLVEEGDLV
jgi:N,N'-diacetyllegionaminate synthase